MTRRSTGPVRKAASLLAVVGLLLGLLGGFVVQATSALAAGSPVSGGGSSFAGPEMQQWVADESGPPANLSVNWAATSSQLGRAQYAAGTLQYGASDIVYYSVDGPAEQQAETQHPFKYVTVSAGGLAFMYNIVVNGTRFTNLELTSKQVCQIFTGAITNWNQLASTPGDAALASVNHPIQVVARQDGAGESYVLSQYCQAVDPGDWATFRNYVDGNQSAEESRGWSGDPGMAAGQPVEFWPTILEGNDSALMASSALAEQNEVSSPNQGGFSIGYMAASYALTAGFPMAAVQNSAGAFVKPDANTVQIALSYASLNSLGTFNLNFNPPNPNPAAYNPSTYSYVLAPTTTNTPASAGADATLAQFLCYAVGAGQNRASRLLYAPLSQQVTQLSVNAIESIPGARAVPNCGVGGPEPQTIAPGEVVINPAPPPPTTAPPSGPAPGAPGSPTATTAPLTGPATATTAPPTGSATTTAPGSAPGAAGGSATTVSGAVAGTNVGGVAGSSGAAGAAGAGSSANGSGTTVPCVGPTTTSTSTTSLPKEGAPTTTLAKGGTTTSTASTTSTTICSASGTGSVAKGAAGAFSADGSSGSGGSGAVYSPSGVLLSGGASGSPTTVQLAAAPTSSSSATNSQAYWYLLVGAVICAIGVGAVEFRRRPAQ